jgi:NAD-dependent SIR2 family protein deacetylase
LDDLPTLREFLARHPRWFVLTGAGISTDSGIPGYRDENGAWRHPPPMTLQEFMRSEGARRRYWARSMARWPRFARAEPNVAHEALAALEDAGRLTQIVTQNVDGLHHRAGSRAVIELHGNLDRVICLGCGDAQPRATLQRALERDNPGFTHFAALAAPDGDASAEPPGLEHFRVPECACCGGILKPDVVFFGEQVPRPRVEAAFAALERADGALVVGSSLAVYSGYRFCVQARALGKPIVAVNRGRTRADRLFAFKLDRGCAEALSGLAN